MIKCKDTDNSNFVANFNSIVNDDDGDGEYKSTNYVKTLICPNGEYTLLVDYKIELSETVYHKTAIKYNGDIYSHHSKTLWVCNKYTVRGTQCRAVIHVEDDYNIPDNYLDVVHNHDPQYDKNYKIININCPPAIHSNDMINAYKIDFDDSSTGHNCQFIPYEQTVVGNYLYVLDNYKAYVDQRMEQIFDETHAQTIPEGSIRFS
uniref:FLYWCH-type domain-containing protein n=1 Tax=Meloidogyne javanica TaxID=6303 RepID=A0A915M0U8_MELJA